jgi:hypothetical protein
VPSSRRRAGPEGGHFISARNGATRLGPSRETQRIPIRVLELHHAIRAGDDEAQAAKVRAFHSDVLGLGSDSGRPTIAGVPGSWINVGEVGQIHLIAGAQPSPLFGFATRMMRSGAGRTWLTVRLDDTSDSNDIDRQAIRGKASNRAPYMGT